MAGIDPRLPPLLVDELVRRGPDGETILAALQGRATVPDRLTPALLAATAQHPPWEAPPTTGPLLWAPEVHRFVLLGDLHGRYDRAKPALARAGVVDEEGRWCAPPGTWLMLVGDLLDADFAWHLPRHVDPRGDTALRTYGSAADGLEGAQREIFAALCHPVPGQHEALLRQSRLDAIGAVHVLQTLEAVRRLRQEAAAAGGRVVVLLGNHEIDLLAGRLWWYGDQKRALMRLLGVEEVDGLVARLRAAPDGVAVREALAPWPLLEELTSWPWVARVGRVLAMHGGPTHGLTEHLLAHAIDSPERLDRWLNECANLPFYNDFFAEGGALFAPASSTDGVARDADLVYPWLVAADADLLAVGHSPFLGFPAGRWVDTRDPTVVAAVQRVERLGPRGHLLALDTGLKRGERAEVVVFDEGNQTLTAVGDDGSRRDLLRPGESCAHLQTAAVVLRARRRVLDALDPLRQPSVADLVELGVDGMAYLRLFDAVDALDRAGLDTVSLRGHLAVLLRAGPSGLEGIHRRVLRARLEGEEGLAMLRSAVEERVETLARRVARQGGAVLRLQLDHADRTVHGEVFRLVDLVADAIADPRPLCAVELTLEGSGAAVLLRRFCQGQLVEERTETLGPFEGWAALHEHAHDTLARWSDRPEARIAASRRVPPPPGPSSTTSPSAPATLETCAAHLQLPVGMIERLVALNHMALGVAPLADELSPPHLDAAPPAGRARIPGAWRRLSAVWTQQRWLMLADLAFVAPELRTVALVVDSNGQARERPHTELLLSLLPGEGAVHLHASLKPEVVRHLDASEPERLGIDGVDARERAPWRRGRFLFTSTSASAARDYRAHNGVAMRFEVEVETLRRLVEIGWWNIALFVGDAGQALDPDAPLGLPDVAIEVVAIGQRGVSLMWEHRMVDSQK